MNTKALLFLVIITVLVTGCKQDNSSKICEEASPAVSKGELFFDNVNQSLSFSPNLTQPIAVACHNCYEYEVNTPSATLDLIMDEIALGADLIELDLILNTPSGVASVNHGTNGNFISFEKLVAHEEMLNSSAMLFLEIKDTDVSFDLIRGFLNTLKGYKNQFGETAYVNQNKLLIIRSAKDAQVLSSFRQVLDETEYSDIKPYVKLSQLLPKRSQAAMLSRVEQSYQCGFHMVEFNSELDIDTLKAASEYAKSIGLGVNVFTVYSWNYGYYIKNLKYSIDVITAESHRTDAAFKNTDSIYNEIKNLISGI